MRYGVFVFLLLISISGCSSLSAKDEVYALKIVSLSEEGKTRHVKFNVKTGETWWASNTEWRKIQEPVPIPESIYDVEIVSTDESWRAIRIDKRTGDSWKNSRGTWVKFESVQ
jgi:hypothetical protein